jgi:erythromycin esterase
MRSRNLVPGNRRKVNFYGFDVAQGYSSPLTSLQSAWRYLDGVDPGYRDSANRQALVSLVEEFLGSGRGIRFESAKRFHELPQEKKNAFKAEIRRLISYFEMHRVDFIRRSSTIEFEWAYRHAVAARQLNDGTEYLVDVLKSGDWARAQRSRDYCQADNICWILDREGPAGRVIVVAHNSHIQRHEVFQPKWSRDAYPTMGLFLQSRIGDDYVPIGFAFERAVDSFQPYEVDGRFELSQTEADSVGSALSRVGLPLFILNLRTAPKDGAVADWLHQERPMIAETDYIPIKVSTAWDALVFVENISYAHR